MKTRLQSLKRPAVLLALFPVYVALGKLSLQLAFVHPSASAVWPPSGFALAALVLLGYEAWPPILLGAFVVNMTTAGSVATSVGVATGNTLEALMGAYLVNQYSHGRNTFDRARDTLKFALLAGLFSTAVGATVGVTSLSLGGYGQPISVLFPSDQHDELNRILEKVKRDVVTRDFETLRRRSDGTILNVSLTVSPVRDAGGKIVGASAIARDINEHKRSEGALREANQKLKTWVNRLERQTHEIALLNQMIELLQTCQGSAEVYAVIRQFAVRLFPGDSGALCMLNPAVNLVETVCVWGKSPPRDQGFSPEECWALRRARLHAVRDIKDPLTCRHWSEGSPVNSLCVPMMAQGETLGVLHLREERTVSSQPQDLGEEMHSSREQLAVTVAGHIAMALANIRLRDKLRSQSIRDPLTGLYNRRFMKESLEREVRRAARNQRPLAVIMLDVDHFKRFNDSLGHDAGDSLLHELGNFFLNRTRGEDIPCRYGGDEFVIILSDTPLEVAVRRARELQEGIKLFGVPHGKEYLTPPTMSLGVSVCPENGSTAEALLHAADQALYQAKAQGRDRVVVG